MKKTLWLLLGCFLLCLPRVSQAAVPASYTLSAADLSFILGGAPSGSPQEKASQPSEFISTCCNNRTTFCYDNCFPCSFTFSCRDTGPTTCTSTCRCNLTPLCQPR